MHSGTSTPSLCGRKHEGTLWKQGAGIPFQRQVKAHVFVFLLVTLVCYVKSCDDHTHMFRLLIVASRKFFSLNSKLSVSLVSDREENIC